MPFQDLVVREERFAKKCVPNQMFYVVLAGDRVAGLYTSPVDAAMRCKVLDGGRVVLRSFLSRPMLR